MWIIASFSIVAWEAFNPVAAGLAVVGIAGAVRAYTTWRYYR